MVKKGDRVQLSADFFNKTLNANKAALSRDLRREKKIIAKDRSFVEVYNDSTKTFPAYHGIRLFEAKINFQNEEYFFTGVLADSSTEFFGISLEPIAPKTTGKVQISGIAHVMTSGYLPPNGSGGFKNGVLLASGPVPYYDIINAGTEGKPLQYAIINLGGGGGDKTAFRCSIVSEPDENGDVKEFIEIRSDFDPTIAGYNDVTSMVQVARLPLPVFGDKSSMTIYFELFKEQNKANHRFVVAFSYPKQDENLVSVVLAKINHDKSIRQIFRQDSMRFRKDYFIRGLS